MLCNIDFLALFLSFVKIKTMDAIFDERRVNILTFKSMDSCATKSAAITAENYVVQEAAAQMCSETSSEITALAAILAEPASVHRCNHHNITEKYIYLYPTVSMSDSNSKRKAGGYRCGSLIDQSERGSNQEIKVPRYRSQQKNLVLKVISPENSCYEEDSCFTYTTLRITQANMMIMWLLVSRSGPSAASVT